MPSVGVKSCSKCRETLPASEFYANAKARTGLSSWCKPCSRRVKADSNARVRAADPEAWCARRRRYVAAYKARHPERTATYERTRGLRRKYGLSSEAYAEMEAAQGGKCAICGNPPGDRPLSVDHDHATGETRALLCDSCNLAIGHLRDSAQLAQAAANYLTKWST